MDEPEIGARNFILCRGVTFDGSHSDAPYSLHDLLSTVRPNSSGVASRSKPIFAYVEFFGPSGDYEVWIDLLALEYDVDGEDSIVTTYGPFSMTLSGTKFIHGRCFCLRHVPFEWTGLHEFHIRLAGVYDPVASQSLYVEERAVNNPNRPQRPPVSRETRGGPHEFIILEMPDPWGHLTEEQKKWFVMDLNAPKNEAIEAEPAPKPNESTPGPC